MLALVMSKRYGSTGKFMPAGIVALISAIACYLQAKRNPRPEAKPLPKMVENTALDYRAKTVAEPMNKGWGYNNVKFVQDDKNNVMLAGDNHYPDLGGKKIPHFIPFVCDLCDVPLEKFNSTVKIPNVERFKETPALSGKARELVEANFEGKLSFEFEERVAHSRGGYFAYVIPSNTRAVDAVIYAESEEDVIKLVDIAKQANFTIIPRGGGTNVSNMLGTPQGAQSGGVTGHDPHVQCAGHRH